LNIADPRYSHNLFTFWVLMRVSTLVLLNMRFDTRNALVRPSNSQGKTER
jgi:hypothetical protein